MADRLVRKHSATNHGAFCTRNGGSVQKFRAYPERRRHLQYTVHGFTRTLKCHSTFGHSMVTPNDQARLNPDTMVYADFSNEPKNKKITSHMSSTLFKETTRFT
jgi:hypothetical protein